MLKEKFKKLKTNWNKLNIKKKGVIVGATSLLVGGIIVGVVALGVNSVNDSKSLTAQGVINSIVDKKKVEDTKKLEETKNKSEDTKKLEETKKITEENKKQAEKDKKDLETKLDKATTKEEKEKIQNQIKEADKIINDSNKAIEESNIVISEVKPEPKPVEPSKPEPKPVEPSKPEPKPEPKPVEPSKPEPKPVEPSKPEPKPEPKPVEPSKPEPKPAPVVVVESYTEKSSENKDFVDYDYDIVNDSNKQKGTSGISKEGSKGYTTYNYTRTVTKYSDGTVKYSDWSVASKSVVAPVNGVKWVGTYEEPQKQGYYNSEAAYEAAAAINSARVANGLPEATYTLDNESAKLTKEYGHLGNGGECIGTGSGYNIVDAWMASGGHRQSILNKDYSVFAIGAYTDEEDVTYFIFYWVE